MKTWKIAPQKFDDPIKQLLYNRGIKTEIEVNKFFHPKLENFEKDFKIAGLEKAKKRILDAIKNDELIVVFGDYDADGVCSLAVMYYAITELGGKFLPYIPHRDKEGYGLSKVGLDYAKEQGAGLVITVDNGIVALEQAKYAKEIGLDLIITDHHLPQDTLPGAYAIVHSTTFCGAGVAWCLVRTMVEESLSNNLLDIVAIATVCDMVPLIGVNRFLVKEGLKKLNHTTKAGLIALIIESGLTKGEIATYHIGHIIGPRINALGRIDHAMDSLRLLCTKDSTKARTIAKHLSEANEQKKLLTIEAIYEAKEIINQTDKQKKIIIVHSEKWIAGIMGLVAGRLVEEYAVPVIAISCETGIAKGSARSTNDVNIVEVIRKCDDLLIAVGGHPKAAGFSIETEKIGEFRQRMEELLENGGVISEGEVVNIDAILAPKQITKKLISDLDEFEPTGVENPKPLLASLNIPVSDIKTVGQGKHLKFKAAGLDAIAFGMGEISDQIKNGQEINVAYQLELNTFNGTEKLQLKVVDLKL
ncbi:MAG: single-stranded-DNA-specific exonuclease RecJ [Candidatus Daviesbacteria bacterium]|nr:single-stranded-DNA-specific exonuclease RecJ [Candidatus Daviesbacteria bacterium]